MAFCGGVMGSSKGADGLPLEASCDLAGGPMAFA